MILSQILKCENEKNNKVWEVIIAISMTLISKIGNNFFQKQQKETKQKPAWMEQFKFKCYYYLYKQDWKLIPIIAKYMKFVKTKQQPAAAVSVRFQHSWISNKPKIVKCMTFQQQFQCKHHALIDMIWQFNLNH